MTDPTREGLALALAQAGWPQTLDRIRSRAVHDLNGRVGSLLAIVELVRGAEGGDGALPPALAYLGDEVEKLERLSARLRSLRADPSAPAEPAAADELTGTLGDTLAWQRGLEGVVVRCEGEEALPPVLVGRERLSAVLFILATRAGLTLAERGGGTLVLAAAERDDGVAWTLSPDPSPDASTAEALGRVLAVDGGRLEPDGSVWIPSLAKARREGR